MRLGNREIVHQMSGNIEPFNVDKIGPCSIDVTLGEGMLKLDPRMTRIYADGTHQDKYPIKMVEVEKDDYGYYTIPPYGCALGTTVESIMLPKTLSCDVMGKSSIGRLFLTIHQTAAFIDPGWPKGTITLEFFNATPCWMYLKPGQDIGQFVFSKVDGCSEGYGDRKESHYIGQSGTTISRLSQGV